MKNGLIMLRIEMQTQSVCPETTSYVKIITSPTISKSDTNSSK